MMLRHPHGRALLHALPLVRRRKSATACLPDGTRSAAPTRIIVGVADFFGNGTNDILFRNNSTGDIWFEAVSNGASAGWHQIGGSDTHYSVVGIGDYLGSNASDILFRNASTGDTWFEAISSGSFAGWNHIGASNTSYSVPIMVGPPALT
jgi:hypothetical protein